MRSWVLIAGAASTLCGCATTPQTLLSRLDTTDPKYGSQECIDARNIAMKYDNKPIAKNAGFVAAMLLGPAGALIYAGAATNNDLNEKAVKDEIRRRCDSTFDPDAQPPF